MLRQTYCEQQCWDGRAECVPTVSLGCHDHLASLLSSVLSLFSFFANYDVFSYTG